MEVTLAVSEGLDIFCVVEPLLLHCPDLGIGPGFAAGTGTARLRIVRDSYSQSVVLIFHPIRQSNFALARANFFPHKMHP